MDSVFFSSCGRGTSVAERVTFELGLTLVDGRRGDAPKGRRERLGFKIYFTCRFGFRLMVAKPHGMLPKINS